MILALLAAVAAEPAEPCALATPDGCATTAAVLALPGVGAGVRVIAGERRANYLSDQMPLVADQAIEVMRTEAEKPRRVATGWLFAGCRQTSCGERGAVVIDTKGEVAGFAILHGACGIEVARPGCARELTLSVWGRDDVMNWRPVFAEWAERVSSGDIRAIYLNGDGEPVMRAQGDFDGDRLPDIASIASVGSQWQLSVARGAAPTKPVVVETLADPAGWTLASAPGGLRYGPAGSTRQLRWTGDRFVGEGAR